MKHTQNETWRTLALAGNSDELRRVRSHVLERAEKLLDGALADGRDLDSHENREFETLKQQAKELGTLVEQSAQRRQRIEQATARYKQDSETSLEWRSFLKGDAVRI